MNSFSLRRNPYNANDMDRVRYTQAFPEFRATMDGVVDLRVNDEDEIEDELKDEVVQ